MSLLVRKGTMVIKPTKNIAQRDNILRPIRDQKEFKMSFNRTHQQIFMERMQKWADIHPDSEAFVFLDKDGLRSVLTCKNVFDEAVKFAKQLKRLGLVPGDIICSMLPDSPNGIIAFFGILFSGCVVMNGTLNLSDGSFLINNLNKTKCRVLLLSSQPDNECRKIFSSHFDHLDENCVSSKTLPHVTHIIYSVENRNHGFQWKTQSPSYDDVALTSNTDASSNAIILQSSGTTGMSKLVLISYESLLALLDKPRNLFEASTFGCINFHSISWALGLPFYYLGTGKKRVFIDQRSPPNKEDLYKFLYDVIVQEKCDFSVMSASHLLKLIEIRKTKKDWPLKDGIVSGFPLPKTTVDIILSYLNSLTNLYGCSEAGVVSFKHVDKNTEFEDFCVGILYPDCQVKIIDDQGQKVENGQTGTIVVKSKHLFSGYCGEDELTRSVFTEDGFLNTNDAGYVNKNGELITYGRISDVIMRGEFYFHPTWIENVIKTCPAVADVIVVKVPDDMLQNEICACVVLIFNSNFNEKTVKEYCQQKFVHDDSAHKSACPKYFIILDKIPLNRNGKPDRKAGEKIASKYLNLE